MRREHPNVLKCAGWEVDKQSQCLPMPGSNLVCYSRQRILWCLQRCHLHHHTQYSGTLRWISTIAGMAVQDLERVAVQVARSGDHLTALNLIQEFAVRCASDPAALMHVCAALNVHKNCI